MALTTINWKLWTFSIMRVKQQNSGRYTQGL